MNKVFIVFSVIALLVGCGNDTQTNEKGQSTQVVAKVNGNEISIHQLNALLANAGNIEQSKMKLASEQALKRLVDLEIVKQKAVEQKLDRDPKVVRQIEQMKQEILAQAYINSLYAKTPLPSQSEVELFYNNHPELFSDRKIYELQEYVIAAEPDKHALIEDAIKGLSSLDAVKKWLQEQGYSYKQNVNQKPAEQIPTEILKNLYPLKEGDNLMIRTAGSLNMLHLSKAVTQSVDLEKAKDVIKQYIVNSGRAEQVNAEMNRLRNSAKVEYLGQFSKMKSEKDTAQKAVKNNLTSQVVN